jgi:hypothetical protein
MMHVCIVYTACLLVQLYRGMIGRRDALEWRTYITHYATIINSGVRGYLARKRAQYERTCIALSWQWLGSHTNACANTKYKQLLPRNKYAVTSTKKRMKYRHTPSSLTSGSDSNTMSTASSIVYGISTNELPGGAAFIKYDRHKIGACSKVWCNATLPYDLDFCDRIVIHNKHSMYVLLVV